MLHRFVHRIDASLTVVRSAAPSAVPPGPRMASLPTAAPSAVAFDTYRAVAAGSSLAAVALRRLGGGRSRPKAASRVAHHHAGTCRTGQGPGRRHWRTETPAAMACVPTRRWCWASDCAPAPAAIAPPAPRSFAAVAVIAAPSALKYGFHLATSPPRLAWRARASSCALFTIAPALVPSSHVGDLSFLAGADSDTVLIARSGRAQRHAVGGAGRRSSCCRSPPRCCPFAA